MLLDELNRYLRRVCGYKGTIEDCQGGSGREASDIEVTIFRPDNFLSFPTHTNCYDCRNDGIAEVATGTFNVVDEKAAPVYGTNLLLKSQALPPVKKPLNFVAPVPKKAMTVKPGTGLSVLPDIEEYARPKKPIILYEYESDGKR